MRSWPARGDTFVRIDTFEHRVSVWACLDRVGRREPAELLLDSSRIHGSTRRAVTVDEPAYFA